MPRQFGMFVAGRELARGAMGCVYEGRSPGGRAVAIKVLKADQGTDPEQLERFEREADVMSRLEHPNIVRVHGSGQDGDERYVVMDLVSGGSLQDRIERGPLPVAEAVAIAEALAGALAVVHEAGVLHRDLKPHNVLLDEQGRPRLTDFGLSMLVDKGLTITAEGTILGSPAFMPPEQANAERWRTGPASDVYGLGATLYAMLSGRPPFGGVGGAAMETLEEVLHRDATPVRNHRPEVDPELDAIVLRCLAKEPAERFPHAQALGEALRRYRQGERGVSDRVAAQAGAGRPVRSGGSGSRLALGLAALLLLALIGGGLAAWRAGLLSAAPAATSPSPTPAASVVQPAGPGPAELLRRALRLRNQGRLADALAALDDCLALDPELFGASLLRAQVLQALKRYSDARSELDRTLRLDGERGDVWALRSEVRLELGDLAGADTDVAQALERQPELPEALRVRALIHLERGHPRDAKADLERARRAGLEDPELAERVRAALAEQ